jgi:hypothetical protein
VGVLGAASDTLSAVGLRSFTTRTVGGRVGDQAIDELAGRLAGVTRTALDTAVRTRGVAVAADADVFRLMRRTLDAAAAERAFVRDRQRRGGAIGVATGLPSVALGLGTAIGVGTAVADAAASMYTEVTLILGLCHLRGRDVRDIEARRLDVLIVLGIAVGFVKIADGNLKADGREFDPAAIDDLDPEVMARINRRLGERVVRKVARRRAMILAGRLFPMGLGVAVAGLEDYRIVGAAGRSAIAYLDLLEAARKASASASSG